MKVVVFGAAGFIGANLSSYLANKAEVELTLFDKVSPRDAPKGANVIIGDFSDQAEVAAAIAGQHVVYHLITSTFPASSWQEPMVEIDSNLVPTISLFEACANSEVKKIVFTSSGGTVYGRQESSVDENTPLAPVSPHAIAKVSIEYFLRYYEARAGLAHDIYRITNPYGPGQRTHRYGLGVIANWLDQIKKGEKLTLYGDGSVVRDFIFIDDVVAMMASSLDANIEKSGVYNISSGEGVSLRDLITILGEVIPQGFEIDTHEQRPSDNPRIVLDNAKIKSRLPDHKFKPLREGLQATWEALNAS